MKKFISCMILGAAVLAPASMDAATINYRTRTLTFSEETPEGKVEIIFSKCMANSLYTFLSVSIDGTVLNQTGSDNIGPFLANGWWMGGNHTASNGAKTANTLSYQVFVDGEEMTAAGKRQGNVMTVIVTNEILYSDGKKFADEIYTYNVSGNSIEVHGHHDYVHPSTINVDRYYGMQSMFIGETEILTPGTPKDTWQTLTVTNSGNEVEFKKKDCPNFCTFVEHSPNGYQASYMLREGLGKREWVDSDNDVIFIGNSWSKCYHKTIGSHSIKTGDSSDWYGIYSWFKKPLADNCRKATDDKTFSYTAYVKGQQMIMTLQADGTMKTEEVSGVEDIVVSEEAPIATVSNGTINVLAADGKCFDIAGKLIHSGAGSFECKSGVYVVSNGHGKSVKLFVK